MPFITIEPASAVEFEYITFQVTLDDAPLDAVTIQYEVLSGTAERNTDVIGGTSPLRGSLTFAPGETTKTIVLRANWETADERDESFFVRLFDPTGASFGENIHSLSTVGWVLDNDGVGLNRAIAISNPIVSEANAGKATFVVSLSQPFATDTTFTFQTHDGTAKAGSDYVAQSGTITFLAGETEQPIEVDLLNDSLAEGTESFSLSITGAHEVTGTTATAQIADDDTSRPVISIDGVAATEYQYLNFTVRLSEPAADAVTVDFNTLSGTAIRGVDFANGGAGTVTFAPGQTTQTIQVRADWESLDELDKSFFVQLSNPVGGTFGENLHSQSAVGWVLDDDGPGLNRAIEVSDIVVNEAAGGKAIFTVSLSEAFDDVRSFDYATFDSSATSANDYIAKTGTVTFQAGQTEAFVEVDLRNDGVAEAGENFGLAIREAHQVKGATGNALIMDDDSTQPIISIESMGAPEYQHPLFTVRLSKPAADAVTVSYRTLSGSAIVGTDLNGYDPLNGTITFAPGQTTQQIWLRSGWESLDELDKNFIVQLYDPVGAGFGGSIRTLSSNGWVLDDDGPGLNRTVAVVGTELREGPGGRVAVFAVELSSQADTDITLRYQTLDGTAKAGQDYDARSGNVTFLAGQTRAEIAVPVRYDLALEGSEQFRLRVIPPFPTELAASAVSSFGTTTILDGTIRGNDAANRLTGTVFADRIEGFGGNDLIRGLGGNDILVGGVGNDQIYGGAGNDALHGQAGNDLLNGEAGRDRLVGGIGNDRYVIDTLDTIVEGANGGIDTVVASFTMTLATHLENLILLGGANLRGNGNAAANQLTGNNGANILDGRVGNDRLAGGGGNDSLFGAAGNDVLIGGAGRDRLVGGIGNDRYVIDTLDVIVEAANGGIDTVEARHTMTLAPVLENLTLLGGASLRGYGNAAANRLTGNAGANILDGRGGNDVLIGGGGRDRLIGGTGNDRYVIDRLDTIVEGVNGGIDTVEARHTMTLGGNLEHLTLLGGANLRGNGNGLANRLTGNAGANILDGRGGNDRLDGGTGNDLLLGGTGNDVLLGGRGTDRLQGDAGLDLLYGGLDGTQRDVFIFRSETDSRAGAARDRIYDFRPGVDDIDLRGIDANRQVGGNQAFDFTGGRAGDHAVWVVKQGANMLVRGDNDSDPFVDFEILVVGVSRLSAGDFLL
ncbi:Calx-beta domain-containing protein [Paracoccus marinaquae]|uniref:M10 family metallopeptidase C-terminal domain-containing protein n=1 Tax=Paracoccus marinaquae TaxID=2841926 RepID=A0ABS6AD95_9RHOB|nr:Calx-beta domain-containing protein [Paracoccus marinaquae]MBU3028546.1 M10 family metallopeptidase C-terminal domain-containing protein [Paracoccus marinaquae]